QPSCCQFHSAASNGTIASRVIAAAGASAAKAVTRVPTIAATIATTISWLGRAAANVAAPTGHRPDRTARPSRTGGPRPRLAVDAEHIRRRPLPQVAEPTPALAAQPRTTPHKDFVEVACGVVEPAGIEPATSCLQSRRSPN